MSDQHRDLRRAYDELVQAADAVYRAAESRLAAERAADRPDPRRIEELEADLVSITQFIDLLESAASVLMERLAAGERGPSVAH